MKVFLSHSKKDRELANKIANDLKKNKIDVWFDEWEILIGDSIINKVQEGLSSCDFLCLIYTKNSMKSNWAEREWQAVLNKEIIDNNIIVLPIKGDDCKLPFIIGDKLYADFSKDYTLAINKLIDSIINQYKRKNPIDKLDIDKSEDMNNEIELKLNIDFNSFTEKDKDKITKAIGELLNADFDIKITKVRRGSVIIRFKLPNEKQTNNFFKKFKSLINKDINIEDAWLVDDSEYEMDSKEEGGILYIGGTQKTPMVYFNAKSGKGEIKGRIIPENYVEFFKPIIDWLENYQNFATNKSLLINVQLEFFNTSSSKGLLDLFKKLEYLNKSNFEVVINWFYEEDDWKMREDGEYYQSIIRVPFKFLKIVD